MGARCDTVHHDVCVCVFVDDSTRLFCCACALSVLCAVHTGCAHVLLCRAVLCVCCVSVLVVVAARPPSSEVKPSAYRITHRYYSYMLHTHTAYSDTDRTAQTYIWRVGGEGLWFSLLINK